MAVRSLSAGNLSRATPGAQNAPFTELWAIRGDHPGSYLYSSFRSQDDSGSDYNQVSAEGSGTNINNYTPAGTSLVFNAVDATWYVIAIVSNGTTQDLWRRSYPGGTWSKTVSAASISAGTGNDPLYYLSSGYPGEQADDGWSLAWARRYSVALSDPQLELESQSNYPVRTSNLVFAYLNTTVALAGKDISAAAFNATVNGTLQSGAAEPTWMPRNSPLAF